MHSTDRPHSSASLHLGVALTWVGPTPLLPGVMKDYLQRLTIQVKQRLPWGGNQSRHPEDPHLVYNKA